MAIILAAARHAAHNLSRAWRKTAQRDGPAPNNANASHTRESSEDNLFSLITLSLSEQSVFESPLPFSPNHSGAIMSSRTPWQALGACLRDARHRAALSQHDIARHLGISQPAYSQFERGLTRPRPALLVPMVRLLGLREAEAVALTGYPLDQVVDALTLQERTLLGRSRHRLAVEPDRVPERDGLNPPCAQRPR
jgi:transcriptional regulator with XRE-family HTH domain